MSAGGVLFDTFDKFSRHGDRRQLESQNALVRASGQPVALAASRGRRARSRALGCLEADIFAERGGMSRRKSTRGHRSGASRLAGEGGERLDGCALGEGRRSHVVVTSKRTP